MRSHNSIGIEYESSSLSGVFKKLMFITIIICVVKNYILRNIMTRDEYLKNALEQWKLWGPEISCEEIKPIMELMLYHTKEKIGIREFFVACRKRYMELNNVEEKLFHALKRAEQYMTEKGVSHEYPVMIESRAALKAYGVKQQWGLK